MQKRDHQSLLARYLIMIMISDIMIDVVLINITVGVFNIAHYNRWCI